MPSRKFIADGPNLYGKYLKGSIKWAELTHSTDLGEIYSGGYLPYSGDTADSRHLFYMARSLRVDLDWYSLDKKRRYQQKAWAQFGLQRVLLSKTAFLETYGSEMTELAYLWMEPRFGEDSLPRERFAYILSKPYLNSILTWQEAGELVAFALLAAGSWGAHYWYVFYRNGTGIPSAPGHGYLVDFIDWARSENLPYAYLGTSYATKSRYKSRGIRGISFWDEDNWSTDKAELAILLENDERASNSNLLAST